MTFKDYVVHGLCACCTSRTGVSALLATIFCLTWSGWPPIALAAAILFNVSAPVAFAFTGHVLGARRHQPRNNAGSGLGLRLALPSVAALNLVVLMFQYNSPYFGTGAIIFGCIASVFWYELRLFITGRF